MKQAYVLNIDGTFTAFDVVNNIPVPFMEERRIEYLNTMLEMEGYKSIRVA